MPDRPLPRRPVDPIALALAAAIREIAAREAAERAERRRTIQLINGIGPRRQVA